MIFGEREEDWKDLLCANAQVELAELIERAKQHRCAYMRADDVKVAQVWTALAEISRQMKKIEARLEASETAMSGIAEMGNIAKRQALKDKVTDLLKAKSREEKEQVDRIVEVLMEF